MQKNVLTTIAAVLLVIYALINFGAGYGQFSKAKLVSGSSSLVANLGEMAGDRSNALELRRQGKRTSGLLYLIAVFILATAVLELVGAIGFFSGQGWAVVLVMIAAVCGVLVEVQDIAEDGFGVGKMIFLAINIIAFMAAVSARRQVPQPA